MPHSSYNAQMTLGCLPEPLSSKGTTLVLKRVNCTFLCSQMRSVNSVPLLMREQF